ncbi:MAG: NAD(P)-binding domain-containing protein, partial [Dehalococcoidia bacterium]
MAERVGVVGLGLMGQSFLVNLLRAGFEVQGFDLDAGRMDAMRDLGGVPVESPAAAARGVSYLLTSLPNSAIVREVALGPDGV